MPGKSFQSYERIFTPGLEYFWTFFNFSLQHFQFSVAFGPFFWVFWHSEGCFLTFFTSLMPAAFHSVKKVKKRPSSGQKNSKNGPQATENWKCFRLAVKKMPKKIRRIPKTIFMSLFIFRLTNFNDIYHRGLSQQGLSIVGIYIPYQRGYFLGASPMRIVKKIEKKL